MKLLIKMIFAMKNLQTTNGEGEMTWKVVNETMF